MLADGRNTIKCAAVKFVKPGMYSTVTSPNREISATNAPGKISEVSPCWLHSPVSSEISVLRNFWLQSMYACTDWYST